MRQESYSHQGPVAVRRADEQDPPKAKGIKVPGRRGSGHDRFLVQG
ncbi:hypothetical protein DAERI_200027 [Deinococcus aerius]|uniref:Uncharacterized protein n=1 Tax=Deinococcus aerius TaxID=200253 RepID=A0A2I9DBC4_9DEIO|nr:hypothetical protein DAERI_200027 [Deinococcus aerius]